MKNLTEDELKQLERFPVYDGKPEHWVGSRDYWASVLSQEKNRNPELHTAFALLHKRIVDMVVAFCKEHDLDVDEANLHINGIMGSKDYGKWGSPTDSFFDLFDTKQVDGETYVDRDESFLSHC